MAILRTPDGERALPFGGERQLVSDALRACGAALDMPCSGQGKCGKCRVRCSGSLSPVTAREREKLTEKELASGVRLACCAYLTGDDAVITLAETAGIDAVTEGESIAFERDPLGKKLGLAADIGTTTVAAYLYDLGTGARLGEAAVKNPQSSFGADVVSRQRHSLGGGAAALKDAVRGCLASLAGELCAGALKTIADIDAAVLTGNTTMLYLLMGYDVADIAAAPFEAAHLFGDFVDAGGLLPGFSESCRVYLPPCISAYVGADITCAILSSGMTRREGPVLLADIGTNGELALFSGGKLLCCSTAAGPAFEGAGIACGSTALPGAVDRVSVENGDMRVHTIGEKPAASLCGSGLLDAAAALLETGLLDESGRLREERVFLGGTDVYITQGDVRNVQLAKAAVRAGIETLLLRAGLTGGPIPELLIAGGFGSRLRPGSAARIGLIPASMLPRCAAIGNAAGSGAAAILLSRAALKRCREIVRAAETVELASSPTFSEFFIEQMLFEQEDAT